MKGYANLGRARDLREIIRLDDVRADGSDVQVEAAVLLTHDLNLRFVLTELLPGYLSAPEAVPAGLGPGHRSFRAAMVDLPATALVYAPEASHDCATPWRPPSLHVCPHHGSRRQHAKLAAILFVVNDESWVRLVVSSANLTRRGFATNLEAGAYEDYRVRGRQPMYPSLFELRQLLTTIAAHSSLEQSRAYKAILEVLPTRRGHRSKQQLHLVHTAEPDGYRRELQTWLGGQPEGTKNFAGSLVVSPFFSAQGKQLRKFAERGLRWAGDRKGPIDLILDGRQVGDERELQAGAPFSTPPRWLHELRGEGSGSFRPAVITRSRSHATPRGSGQHGRPLHAKIIGAAWRRKRTTKRVWRLLIGSSNFSEGGLGLAGQGSSLEAGFLVQYKEKFEHDVFGPRSSVSDALCVKCPVAQAPADRSGADLTQELAINSAGKQWLHALDHAKVQVDQVAGGFLVTVQFESVPDRLGVLRLGEQTFTPAGAPGCYQVTVETLNPYFIAVVIDQRSFAWPLPSDIAGVWSELLAAAAGRRRVDRLLDFWLAASSSPEDPDDEDLDDGMMATGATSDASGEAALGSWRINRLMLGLRRRLAESVQGIRPRLPVARALLGSVRVQELLQLTEELTAGPHDAPVPGGSSDLLYFGTLVRAALLGYHAAESRGSRRVEWAEVSSPPVKVWEDEAWLAFEDRLARCRGGFGKSTLAAIDTAAGVVFDSVREGEIVQ